jgi:hypothetical protein
MGNSKRVISTSVVVTIGTLAACAILQPALSAQLRPRFALTEARLEEAFAEVREDRAPELADILTQRAQRVDLRTPTGDGMFVSLKDYFAWKEKYPPPFNVFVASPFMRAVATAFDARRRYMDPPLLTAAALNADGILVSVTPGDDFARADAIDDVVLKTSYDGRIIRPFRRDVQPVSLQNRGGALKTLSAGAFYFRLEDFDQLPVTVICIGAGGNFEIGVSLDDIRF